MPKIIWILIACILFISCSSSKKSTLEYKQLEPLSVRSSSSDYRATKPTFWDILHTKAILSFDLKERIVKGKAWLDIHPYSAAMDSLVLDAKSMDVKNVVLKGRTEEKLFYRQQDDKLIIKLNKAYNPEDTLLVMINYIARPYAEKSGGSAAITDDRGLYFINTDNAIPNKPAQIWTQGETESNSHWLPTIDQPNERFTVELTLIVPDSFITLSNGAMIKSEKQNNNLRSDTWKMDKPIQTYAIMFAIGKFAVVNDQEWRGKEINYYVETEYAPYAKQMFNNTNEMMDYFSKITGVSYPWNKYSQIVVRDFVSGAMENTSASLFGEFMNQNSREIADKNYEDIVSHELFHQWFGDYVTAESWSNLTLNESFANYGEQLWRLHYYGKASNDELAYEDLKKYLDQAKNEDPPLVRYYYNDEGDMFDRVSYQKGGAILHYLHGLIGDSAFYKAMNIYLTNNALQSAEVSDWRKAVEVATGKDWSLFFNQWYYRGGHPDLRLDYQYDDANQKLNVELTQTQSDSSFTYKIPLKATLVYGDKKEIIDWNILRRSQTFSYPYKEGIKPVFIPDTEHWLVGGLNDKKKTQQWLLQLTASNTDYISKRRAVNGAFIVHNDPLAQDIFHRALKDEMKEIRYYTLFLLQRMPDIYNWRKNFQDEVSMLAMNDGHNKVRANAFDVLGNWKINSMKNEMIKALSDSSYMVAGAALNALENIEMETAYEFSRKILAQDPKAELKAAAWNAVASNGKSDDIVLFKNESQQVYGKMKMDLSNNLSLYSISTKDDAIFEQGLALLTTMSNEENIKTYRFNIGALIFYISNYYEVQLKDKDKSKIAAAKKRVEVANKYEQQILANEKDKDNLKKYNAL